MLHSFFRYKRLLAGISDFSEDNVRKRAAIQSGGIYSHDGSKSNTDSDYNPNSRHSQFLHPSIEKSCSTHFIQEIVITKLIIIITWLGKLNE